MKKFIVLIFGVSLIHSVGLADGQSKIPAKYRELNRKFQEFAARNSHGLQPTSLDEVRENQIPQVLAVRPNRLSIQRLNEERRREGLTEAPMPPPLLISEEIEVGEGDIEPTTATQPRRADNSLLPAFPPIGWQANQNSCVAWATTYYQLSFEYCMVHGCSFAESGPQAAFSPSWTYNMINGGQNSGTWFSDAYQMITKNGAATLAEMPYINSNYRIWDLRASDWLNALRKRSSVASIYTMNTDTGINNAKQLLANGHVLTFGTYISSWTNYQVGSAPGVNNTVAGQTIGVMVDGYAGSHAMTLVGFDDTVWVDLNQNNIVEPKEKGAFKIANQWGDWFENSGFIWLSYDALRSVSAVAGGPSSPSRQPAIQASRAYVLSVPEVYEPQWIARVTLKSRSRNHVQVTFGASDNFHHEPQVHLNTGALMTQGGDYAFDGTTTAVEGTFYFDITDLVQANPDYQTYYILVTDTVAGNPITVSSVVLFDQQNSRVYPYRGRLPQTVDNRAFRARFPASVPLVVE